MGEKIKLGRWRERGGGVATVRKHSGMETNHPWVGTLSTGLIADWMDDGSFWRPEVPSEYDLIEYLGRDLEA